MKRAPRIYFRALGLFVGVAALDGFVLASKYRLFRWDKP